MDTVIRTFTPNSEGYKALAYASEEMTKRSKKGTRFVVEDTYFDYGQNWTWTTIIAYRPDGDCFQAIYPSAQEQILFSDDIPSTVAKIMNEQYWFE